MTGSAEERKNAFRKFLFVYQYVTSLKRILFETIIFFSRIYFYSEEISCNFALVKPKDVRGATHVVTRELGDRCSGIQVVGPL